MEESFEETFKRMFEKDGKRQLNWETYFALGQETH